MFTIDVDDRIAVYSHKGPLFPDDVLNFYSALQAHPDYSEDIAVVYDFRDANLEPICTAEMKFFMEQHALRPGLFVRNAAFVAEKELEFGTCRMWLAYATNLPSINRMVFRSFSQARNWLISLRNDSSA